MNDAVGSGVVAPEWSTMADPLVTVADVARSGVRRGGRAATGSIPSCGRRDRADAQANGVLALAKQLGRNPREVAQAIIDTGVLAGVCSSVEVAGPGFINLVFDDDFLARELAAVARRRPTRRAGRGSPANGRRRLLRAERRQGDARRPPALDDHRRRARADARVRRARRHPREPHRRLGHAVRDADRAPARHRRGRGSRSGVDR